MGRQCKYIYRAKFTLGATQVTINAKPSLKPRVRLKCDRKQLDILIDLQWELAYSLSGLMVYGIEKIINNNGWKFYLWESNEISSLFSNKEFAFHLHEKPHL